jgi:fructoselysine 6-kinase
MTAPSRPRFAVVGDNTIDAYLGQVERRLVGGNALNCAVQLAARGLEVEYFGAVGDDEPGRLVQRVLDEQAVGREGLVRMTGDTALTLVRVLPSGERVFEKEDFGVTARYYPDDESLERIATADWVHIGMLPRAPELVTALRARRREVRISQDCAVSSGAAGLTVGFQSAGEHGDAEAIARHLLAQGALLAVATRGPQGAVGFDGRTVFRQPAVLTEVVDTTGAGDSFISGFISARLQEEPIPAALAAGARWAAATCGHLGGFRQE